MSAHVDSTVNVHTVPPLVRKAFQHAAILLLSRFLPVLQLIVESLLPAHFGTIVIICPATAFCRGYFMSCSRHLCQSQLPWTSVYIALAFSSVLSSVPPAPRHWPTVDACPYSPSYLQAHRWTLPLSLQLPGRAAGSQVRPRNWGDLLGPNGRCSGIGLWTNWVYIRCIGWWKTLMIKINRSNRSNLHSIDLFRNHQTSPGFCPQSQGLKRLGKVSKA